MSAIFPLVHFHFHMFVTNPKGQSFDIVFNEYPPYNCQFSLTYNFSKDSSPSNSQITVHGLERGHAKKYFVEGSWVTVFGGWANSDYTQNDYGELFSEKITSVAPMPNSGGDWQLSFTCTDGQSLNNESSLSKLKSKSVRADSSDRLSDRTQIQAIDKLFGKKRISLNKFLKNKRAYIKAAKDKIHANKEDISKRRHYWVKKFEAEDAALKGKRKGSATSERNNIKAARNRIKEKLHNEDEVQTKLSKALTSKSKSLTHFGSRKRKALTRNERHRKTRARGSYERKKRDKSKRKSKSVKHKNGLHFKKGTYASTIIRRLAKRAHIHITRLKLVKNKRYNAGYTADKKPIQCIQDVVNDCDSAIWWAHGKLLIGDFSSHMPNDFVLTPRTGLFQTPQEQDDDDNNSKVTNYEVNCILLPFFTTGADFRIKDPIKPLYAPNKEPISTGSLFNDEVIVLQGSLSINPGDTPTADLIVVPKSQEKAAETEKVKSKAKKIKSKKDAAERHRTKMKRHARQKARRKK